MCAQIQQHVRRTFYVSHTPAGDCVPMQCRHALALGVERNFLHAWNLHIDCLTRRASFGRRRHQRAFRRITDHARLSVPHLQQRVRTAQSAAQQFEQRRMRRCRRISQQAFGIMKFAARFVASSGHRIALSTGEHFHNDHRVLRQRAGLVRANYGGAAQRLDCAQTPRQRMPLHQLTHADRQVDRDDRRQPFRHRRHRQAHSQNEHLVEHRAFAHQVRPQTVAAQQR